MGGNQISMAVGAEFAKRRTVCGREWVELRSTWPLVLNSQDDTQTVGENGWKTWPVVQNSQDNALSVGEGGWK
jgi:hypothetical protein